VGDKARRCGGRVRSEVTRTYRLLDFLDALDVADALDAAELVDL